jgi:vacuolar-type H+-ATPase subunit H
MQDTDFDFLCNGLPAEEAKRMRKILAEWSDGDENGFPVQLALLTRVQWRAASLVPQAVNESRKLIESHLAEYRRQTKVMLDDFSGAAQKQAEQFRAAAEKHGQTIQQAVMHIKLQIVDAELVARRVKLEMEDAESEWRNIKTSTTAQCKRLAEISSDLQERFAWRVIIWWAAGLSVAFALGYCFGLHWIR